MVSLQLRWNGNSEILKRSHVKTGWFITCKYCALRWKTPIHEDNKKWTSTQYNNTLTDSETYRAVGFLKGRNVLPTPPQFIFDLQSSNKALWSVSTKPYKNGSRFSTFEFPCFKKKRVWGWEVLQPRTDSAQQKEQDQRRPLAPALIQQPQERHHGEQKAAMIKLVLLFYKAGTDGPGRLRVSFSWNFSHISRATFPLFAGKGSPCRRPMSCQWFCSMPQPKPEKGI